MSRLSRRGLLTTGAAASVLAATGLQVRAQARQGGRLRMALGGASTADTWDSRTHSDLFMQVAGQGAVFDTLTEIAADGSLKGELATDWDSSPDARVWTFTLRRGVTFHNGKPFGAEDVIASLMLHLDPAVPSPARPLVEDVVEMRKIGDHQVRFTLRAGNADLPFVLADYHLLIYPAGQVDEAMSLGIGTGLYRVERFAPGARFQARRVEAHYKDGEAGWFDELDIVAMNDPSARFEALLAGHVDVVPDLDPADAARLSANPSLELFKAAGNRHLAFPMRTDLPPFDDPDLRRALKHAVDREGMLDAVLFGHGEIGNDSPIGPANQYRHPGQEQTAHDPDRVRFHLRRAGMEGVALPLAVSEAAFPGALRAARHFRDSAAAAGLTLDLVHAPADRYWAETWPTAPFRAAAWSGRPTEDMMFSTAYLAGAPWNDTAWSDPQFQALLHLGRAEFDSDRRHDICVRMQDILRDSGGVVVPLFADFIGAKSARVAHSGRIGAVLAADGGRIAERWWRA